MVSDDATREFITLLHARFGWRLDDERAQLSKMLASRLGYRQSVEDYLAALRSAPDGAPEVRALAEALAVSETYFFRNPDQFAVLADVALPAVAVRHAGRRIRILSAGAASGEEAYSIAMTVTQVRKRHDLPDVEIRGIDVSQRAVAKARGGRYSAWALRGLPAPLRDEFFHHDGTHFDVRRDVAEMVSFTEGNLLELATVAPGPWDIVFFRNTFMYFTRDVARRVFSQLAAAMPPEAYLFLGHAETLRGVSDAFALRHAHEAFFYVREPAAGDSRLMVLPQHTAPPPERPRMDALPVDDSWFLEIARATQRVAELVDGRLQRPPDATPGTPAPAAAATAATGLAQALSLLADERHEAALAALGEGREPERLLLRAILLANMGRLADARATSRAVLAVDGMHAGAYYVQALCEEREGNDSQSIKNDETAIYLDDTFAAPHLHLSLIARRRGDRSTARRHAQRARELFVDEDQLRILLFGGGFNRYALLQLCDAQVQSLAS